MPKAFSEREREIIRARLIEQGHKTFATYGLRRTNIEDLTNAAGISKGAFYLFYESKEALYMDVVEEAEARFRSQILVELDQPGPTPRARLKSVFLKAFSIWKSMPVLRMVNKAEYELLLRRIPVEKLMEHLQSDRQFIDQLFQRANEAGIPITADAEKVSGLMHALFFVTLHEEDFGEGLYGGTVDLLVDLVSGYCVGAVEVFG